MLTPTVVALLVCCAPAPLMRPGSAHSAYIGIDPKPVEGGLLVDLLYVNSPAEQAGLSSYDVITSINGTSVRSVPDLVAVLRKCKPDVSVPVAVYRNGDTSQPPETVQVKLALKKAYCYFGANLQGTRIVTMPEESPARRAGIQANDVVKSVDGTAVSSSKELVTAMSQHRPGDTIPFLIDRNGEEKKVMVTIGARPGY